MEAIPFGDYGVIGGILFVVYGGIRLAEKIVVPLVMSKAGKWHGQPNGRERRSHDVVTLESGLKSAIYDTKRDAEQTVATLTTLRDTSVEMLTVLKQIAANGNKK